MAPNSLSQALVQDAERPDEQNSTLLSPGMQMTMRNVGYSVRSAKTRGHNLQLLKNITGYFNPGQMAALIGPSGSGKTTLLDVLAGRKTQGEISGEILFSKRKSTRTLLRRYVGYVEQFDVLIETLTVFEMLIYTAELKRPMSESYQKKATHVNRLIEKLLLAKSKDKKIGDQGGIKKRVNIGIALVSNPRVLFLDEPTTGLDSYTANETMSVVKNMAINDGTTICSTIHSPTPYTFSLFDNVLFILGGEVMFFGETGKAVTFLQSFGQGIDNDFDNEADWLTTIIVKADREHRGPEIAAAYSQSLRSKEVDDYLQDSLDVPFLVDDEAELALDAAETPSIPSWFAFKTLMKYRTAKHLVTPTFWISRMADKFTFLCLLLLTYHGVGDDFSFPKFQNIVSVLFMLVCFPMFGAGVYAPTIVLERSLMYREMNDGMYNTGTFLLMKFVDETFAGLISTTIITTTAWKILKLQGSLSYFFLIYFGNLLNGIATAYVCAAVGSNVNMANAFLATYTAVLLFFAGMLILPNDMPVYWRWIYKLNYAAYAFGVLMYDTFTSSEEAESARFVIAIPPVSVLEYYELDDVNKNRQTAVVYLFVAGHLFLAYICTRFVRHQKR